MCQRKRTQKAQEKENKSRGWEGELLTKYCWIVYKLQQWVEKPGKDDKASFATDLDRQCLSVPDDAAQLNDRLHVGHGRLNLRVDQVFPCLGQWQEVDATRVFGRSSLASQQVAHVLIHQLREERGEGCLGREGIQKNALLAWARRQIPKHQLWWELTNVLGKKKKLPEKDFRYRCWFLFPLTRMLSACCSSIRTYGQKTIWCLMNRWTAVS